MHESTVVSLWHRWGSLAAVLLLLISCGCSDGPRRRQRIPSPEDQFEAILRDLQQGLTPIVWGTTGTQISARQNIEGAIIEPRTDPLTAKITIKVESRFDILPKRDEEESSGGDNGSRGNSLEIQELDGEADPLSGEGDLLEGTLTGSGSGPLSRELIEHEDEFTQEILLEFRKGEWVLTSQPKWQSIRDAVKHALAVQ